MTKHIYRSAACFPVTFTALLLLAGLPTQVRAEGEPLHLRSIMQDLVRNMQSITRATSEEDWVLVAELSPKVATHPEPPLAEKLRILAYLGSNASEFRALDEQTRKSAHAMEQAAERGDGKMVIQSFARVQESCLGCHQIFRTPFMEHFYGQH